jgi:hypothetical protein
MKKIGIAVVTLLAAATAACAESPTATAEGAAPALNGGLGGSGNREMVTAYDGGQTVGISSSPDSLSTDPGSEFRGM